MNLSTRDKEKPFILMAAAATGLALQHFIGEAVPGLLYVTEIGVSLVIVAVMLPVDLTEVGRAAKRVKPTAVAVFINFVLVPLVSWTSGWLILRQYPDLWAGAILYTLTPCIGWYLIFTDIAKGNVAWGIALLPWNVTLQVVLLPAYLYFLVGKVLPVDFWVLARSVGLYLVAPFVLSAALRPLIIHTRGYDYFNGPFKRFLGEVKLWALVVVIVSMFVSQEPLGFYELSRVSLLILFLIAFFLVFFLIALLAGRLFALSYEDNATLAFSTTARNSEAVIGVAVSAFPGHPLVYLAIILGPVVELPMLLVIARMLLALKDRIAKVSTT
jgi:arsenite transporter